MRLRTVVLLAIFALLGLFAVLNWPAFVAPATLELLVMTIEAPLGFLMLMAMGVLSVLFLLMMARSEIAMLLENRRLSKELEASRRMAADAESSRVEGMRTALLNELAEVNRKLDQVLSRSNSASSLV